MNISDIKKEFPIFSNKVQNNDLVYLDSANSAQNVSQHMTSATNIYHHQTI